MLSRMLFLGKSTVRQVIFLHMVLWDSLFLKGWIPNSFDTQATIANLYNGSTQAETHQNEEDR